MLILFVSVSSAFHGNLIQVSCLSISIQKVVTKSYDFWKCSCIYSENFYWIKTNFWVNFMVYSETDKRMKDVDLETKQLQAQIQNLHFRLTNLEDEKRSLENEARESSIVHAEREKNLQILMKDYEYAKNRENDLLVDKWDLKIVCLLEGSSNFFAKQLLTHEHLCIKM